MAIGNPPKVIFKIPVSDLTKKQCLTLSMKAVLNLEWNVKFNNSNKITAYTKSPDGKNEKINIIIGDNTITVASASMGDQIIDWGSNKSNTESFANQFQNLKSKYSVEEIEIIQTDLRSEVDPITPFEKNELGELTSEGQVEDYSIFVPRKGYLFTPLLMYLNILVFIIMVISGVHLIEPTEDSLLLWGANFKPLTLDGEYWRLFTSFFLHIGVIHVVFNMYALLFIGLTIEPYLGRLKFISAYLATGILSSIASLYWNDFTISAGASGAIFGLYGVFLALLATRMISQTDSKALGSSVLFFIGYNLFFGFTSEGIDNAAHIGGLLSGIVIGFAFYLSLKKPRSQKINHYTTGAIILTTLLISLFSIRDMNKDHVGYGVFMEYESNLTKFAELEEEALIFFDLPTTTTNYDYKTEIKKGIDLWGECISLLKNSNKLSIPNEDIERNQKLIKYCELRIKCYELFYHAITNNTGAFDQDIQKYSDEIEAIINNLN